MAFQRGEYRALFVQRSTSHTPSPTVSNASGKMLGSNVESSSTLGFGGVGGSDGWLGIATRSAQRAAHVDGNAAAAQKTPARRADAHPGGRRDMRAIRSATAG